MIRRSSRPQGFGRNQPINFDALNRALMEASGPATAAKQFELPEFPPGVRPSQKGLAMDDAFGEGQAAFPWATAVLASAIQEGEIFLGYSVLSEMALRPEYRQISASIAEEIVRKWIDFGSKSGGEKSDRISDIKDEMERLGVREIFKKIAEHDGYFGRSHLYIDTGDTDSPDELTTSIGSGRDDASLSKIKKGSLKGLKVIEPVWIYPLNYNATDPLKPDWYCPQLWQVYGKQVHRTRLLTFVSHEVPDILKPAYAFGGLPRTQMARPYVQNWLRTRQSISDLIHSFSVSGILMDLAQMAAAGGAKLMERLKMFLRMKDIRGLMLLNKDTEEYFNVSTPLGGLPELQSKSQEMICGVSRIPVVKYLGIQPAGLNASSKGELTVWYDYIRSQQESFFRQHLQTVIDFIQLSKWGDVDEDITFDFEPLEEMDPLQAAQIEKTKAETDQIRIDSSVLAPLECRERIASDPDSEYNSIDVEDVPEPPGMGEFGEMPPDNGFGGPPNGLEREAAE